MPIRGSPNDARHPHPQAGRDRPEWVVAINRNAWSQSIGIAGRDHPVRAIDGAQKTWRRLDGHNQLPKIIRGVKFTDGLEVVVNPAAIQAQTAAA